MLRLCKVPSVGVSQYFNKNNSKTVLVSHCACLPIVVENELYCKVTIGNRV